MLREISATCALTAEFEFLISVICLINVSTASCICVPLERKALKTSSETWHDGSNFKNGATVANE